MTRCFIALGSNLEQPLAQVMRAAEELAALPESRLIALSPWYQSTAIGPGEQTDYINGVAELQCKHSALELLAQLQLIENKHQRQRLERWGPRTLDLDLLLYGNETINEPTLIVPHPRMLERHFVLQPLFDIVPTLTLSDGSLLKHHLERCPTAGLRLVKSTPSLAIASNQDKPRL